MPTKLITAPARFPVSLVEAKQHMNVSISDDDGYINNLIRAVTNSTEIYLQRALITQTLDVLFDRFEACIEIPKAPLQSVTSVTYIDSGGDTQTLATSVYDVDINADPGIIRLAYGQSWPSVRLQANAVTIRIIAGYGLAGPVPMSIRHAMLIQIAHLHEVREPVIVGTSISSVPFSYESLLSPYRVVRF